MLRQARFYEENAVWTVSEEREVKRMPPAGRDRGKADRWQSWSEAARQARRAAVGKSGNETGRRDEPCFRALPYGSSVLRSGVETLQKG